MTLKATLRDNASFLDVRKVIEEWQKCGLITSSTYHPHGDYEEHRFNGGKITLKRKIYFPKGGSHYSVVVEGKLPDGLEENFRNFVIERGLICIQRESYRINSCLRRYNGFN